MAEVCDIYFARGLDRRITDGYMMCSCRLQLHRKRKDNYAFSTANNTIETPVFGDNSPAFLRRLKLLDDRETLKLLNLSQLPGPGSFS